MEINLAGLPIKEIRAGSSVFAAWETLPWLNSEVGIMATRAKFTCSSPEDVPVVQSINSVPFLYLYILLCVFLHSSIYIISIKQFIATAITKILSYFENSSLHLAPTRCVVIEHSMFLRIWWNYKEWVRQFFIKEIDIKLPNV